MLLFLLCVLFFARLTQYTFFLSRKTEYFNTVTQQYLLFMPLKKRFYSELRPFLLLCFSNLHLFPLNHTSRAKDQRCTLFQRHRFCWRHAASARRITGRWLDPHQERITTRGQQVGLGPRPAARNTGPGRLWRGLPAILSLQP